MDIWLDAHAVTVVPLALVTRVLFDGTRAAGVEVIHGGAIRRVTADAEVVLSLGAIHTPKVLMQSGIGGLIVINLIEKWSRCG